MTLSRVTLSRPPFARLTPTRPAPRKASAALAVAFAIFAAGLSGARADESQLPPMPKPLDEMAATRAVPADPSMEAWGKAHPDCLEWTDACQVCVAGDKPGCSVVSTACVRVAPSCRRTRAAEQPDPAPTPAPRPADASTAPQAPAAPVGAPPQLGPPAKP